MSMTKLNSTTLNNLYSTPTKGTTFGNYLNNVVITEGGHTNGTGGVATNCTASNSDILEAQWVGSRITRVPIYWVDGGPDVYTDEYIGTSFSMANWGNWSTPNMTYPPEISAYMNAPYASTADDFNIYF